MPVLKLTQMSVKTIPQPPETDQILYFDTDLKGFGLRISGKTNTRAFIIQRSLPGGKTRQITIGRTNILTVEEARARAKKLMAKFLDGCDPKEEKEKILQEQKAVEERHKIEEELNSLTLQKALDKYLENSRIKPATKKSSRALIENNLTDWLDKPLREINRGMVAERHTLITNQVAERGKKNPMINGHGTANGVMRVLRVVWNEARASKVSLPENPVSNFRRIWHKDVRRTRYVTFSELPAFYKTVQTLPNAVYRHYLLLLLFTGLRRNEAAALKWTEVDFAERKISLTADRTKASRQLDLPMSDFVYELLQDRQKDGQEEFVFPSVTSKSGHLEEPKFALDQIEEMSGIKACCHDLRRTFATVAESCEISAYALKGLINHSYGQDVTAGYISSNFERLKKPMKQVTDKLLTLINGEQQAETG